MEREKLKTKLVIWKDKIKEGVHNIEGKNRKCERNSRNQETSGQDHFTGEFFQILMIPGRANLYFI